MIFGNSEGGKPRKERHGGIMKKAQVFYYILESEFTKGLFIHYVIQVGCIGVVDQNMT